MALKSPYIITFENAKEVALQKAKDSLHQNSGHIGAPQPVPPKPAYVAGAKVIKTAPGIGDILWLIMKLSTLGEKFNWRIAGDMPQRGHQIFELLPQTVATVTYGPEFHAGIALANNIQTKLNSWEQIKTQPEFFLTINHHFEAQPAKNLKEWLPDLGINYHLPYVTYEYTQQAKELLRDTSKKYVIFYGASYMASRYWGFWQSEQWFEFITKLRASDNSIVPVIVGALWDTDMTGRLMQLLASANIPYVKLVGEKLGLVVEVMKMAKYAFYFPSGLGVIAGTLGVPATMWYPEHLKTMPGTWCDPKLTEADIFHETSFCSPDDMVAYINKRGGF